MTLEAEKVLCFPSKVPFIIDQSQPNLYQLYGMCSEW